MTKIFSLKTIRWVMIIVLIISLLPLLAISFFSYPMADDFSFSTTIRNAWNQSNSLLSVGSALINSVVDNYLHWQGSYTSTFLGSLQPGVLGEHMYFLTTWILLSMTIIGTFAFIRSVFRNLLKHTQNELPDITACICLILFIQWVPSPVQSFFWWDGSIVYIGIQMIAMCALASIVFCVGSERCSAVRLILMLIASFFIGGGNYITGLLYCELLALCLIYSFWKNNHNRFVILAVFFVAITFLLVNALAPGNRYRQSSYTPMSLLPSLAASFSTALNDCICWLPRIMAGALFLVPFFWLLPVQDISRNKWLLPTAIALGFCLQASMYEPTFFAIGNKGTQRLDNVRFYIFVLQCILWLYMAIQLIKSQWQKKQKTGCSDETHSRWIRSVAIVTAIVILLTGALTVYEFKVHQVTMTSASALVSLFRGKAQAYRSVNLQRLEILQSDEPNVVLPAYTDPPYVLLWADITSDPTYWVNTTLAEYYGKETIVAE